MSAKAAREIISVSVDICEVRPYPGAPSEVVRVDSLKRPELLRAAKVRFPAVSGRKWQSVGNEAIVAAIASGDPSVSEGETGETDGGSGERPNRFPGTCGQCGTRLAAGNGRIRKEGTKWATYCPSHLPTDGNENGRIEWSETTTPPPPPEVKGDGVTDALTGLITQVVRAEVAKGSQSIDADAVRSIVAAYVDEQAPRRIEIVTEHGTRELPKLHHNLLPEVVAILGSGVENVFLVGPAGSGKSTIGEQAAEALGNEFRSMSFGPTTPTSKLFGYNDANGNHVRTPFRDAYEYGHVFIGDELDNGHPGLVAELNQALANGFAACADGMVKKHASFRFVATGNTFGRGPDRLFVGRNILDAATLDRFVTVECPVDERLERQAALQFATDESEAAVEKWIKTVQAARANVEAHKLPLVCSPRSSINGAKLLTAGLAVDRVKELTLTAGWSNEHRQKVGV